MSAQSDDPGRVVYDNAVGLVLEKGDVTRDAVASSRLK